MQHHPEDARAHAHTKVVQMAHELTGTTYRSILQPSQRDEGCLLSKAAAEGHDVTVTSTVHTFTDISFTSSST